MFLATKPFNPIVCGRLRPRRVAAVGHRQPLPPLVVPGRQACVGLPRQDGCLQEMCRVALYNTVVWYQVQLAKGNNTDKCNQPG